MASFYSHYLMHGLYKALTNKPDRTQNYCDSGIFVEAGYALERTIGYPQALIANILLVSGQSESTVLSFL